MLAEAFDAAEGGFEAFVAGQLLALRLLARFPDTVTEPVQPSRHGLFSLGGVEAHAAAQQLCGNAQARGKLILLHLAEGIP